jgi:hypothetical protein
MSACLYLPDGRAAFFFERPAITRNTLRAGSQSWEILEPWRSKLSNWDEPDDPWPDVWMQPAPTRAGAFPTKRDLIARYAARTGFDVRDVDYYRAFNYWRIAVIAEGMKRRYETGALSSADIDIAAIAQRVVDRARMAEFCLDLAGA